MSRRSRRRHPTGPRVVRWVVEGAVETATYPCVPVEKIAWDVRLQSYSALTFGVLFGVGALAAAVHGSSVAVPVVLALVCLFLLWLAFRRRRLAKQVAATQALASGGWGVTPLSDAQQVVLPRIAWLSRKPTEDSHCRVLRLGEGVEAGARFLAFVFVQADRSGKYGARDP